MISPSFKLHILYLQLQFSPAFTASCLCFELLIILQFDHLSLDKTLFKIRMNHSCSRRGFPTLFDGPRP